VINQELIIGRVSKKTKIEAGLKKRLINNIMRKTGVSNIGSFDSMFISSFSFVLFSLFEIHYPNLEIFMSRAFIYSEYASHYNLILAFEFYVIFFVICSGL
jgi:hypothetical protein